MANNGKWKESFKDFFFDKESQARNVAENVADTLEKVIDKEDDSPGQENGTEGDGNEDQTNDELTNGDSGENEVATDENKSLINNNNSNATGTMKGRLLRMFSKLPGHDEEGDHTGANDDDKNAETNGKTNQVQMVDKSVSTEDKDDIPDNKEDTNIDNSENSNTVIESPVEEKKRFRFQLFSK